MLEGKNQGQVSKATRKISMKIRWPIFMRTLHYYSSMATCFLILFYAVSGFIATHADWFLEGHKKNTSYDIRELEEDTDLEAFCLQLVGEGATLKTVENDEDELWYIVANQDSALRCLVNEDDAEVEVFGLESFPETAQSMDAQFAHVQSLIGGEISHEHEDDEYMINTCDIESVWFEAEVMVFADHGVYEVAYVPRPFIRSVSDLHRGKHSNVFQTFLADVTAVLLAFVVITGAVIGIQMKKKRRAGTIALIVSFVLTVILLWAR
ncbi:MAG: PepSY-associated TM helix domain-containing protein [Planctomycetes bacterium]|nr:PepSY-associated TM helix domain-containing protein [Planctomycetota bacterium]